MDQLINKLKMEVVNAVLVDNTGVVLSLNFDTKDIRGIVVIDMNNDLVKFDDIKWANSNGAITVTANLAGNVTRTCQLGVFYRD